MKICFLHHNLIRNTGAGRFGLALIERLRKARPNIDAVVLTSVGCGHPLERAILYPSKLKLILVLPRIRKVFRQCDIIHALDGWPYGVITALASIGFGKKLVITAIGTGAIQALDRPLVGWLLCWAYRRADRVIAISNYTRREILHRVPKLKIEVINHAVDFSDFESSSDRELTPEERAVIEKVKPYVLSVGGWKKRKGFEYSFAAFAEVNKRFPNLNYVVVGIGPKPRLTEPLGISNRVFYFKGIRWPFLKAIYRHAELFILLPFNDRGDVEGFGFAFLEAAAAGLPVVGAKGSGAEDAVSDGENGFLVEPRNAAAAAQAAVSILSHPALKQRFSEESITLAKRMNWGKVIQKYIAIYESLTWNL